MKKKGKAKIRKLCKCGCRRPVKAGNKFIHGHHFKDKKHSVKTKDILRKKRVSKLRADLDNLSPHRLKFPKKKRGESEGDYRFRKFEYFCLYYVTHVHGKYAGKPVRLMQWQRTILKKLLGILDANGKRIYRWLFVHIGRKNGKTFLTCLLVLYWLAEESFRDLTAEIVSCANTREQSLKTIFRTCRLMVNYSKELSQMIKIGLVPAHLTNLLTNASFEPLSADAKPQLGKNLSLVIFDETHGQPNSELWDAMATSQSMREEPLFVSISTAGDSRASFYYTIYERAKEILADPSVDPTALVVIYEVPEEADWRDPKNFLLANPAADDKDQGFRSIDELNQTLKKAIDGEGEGAFKQFYLNMWSQHGQRTLVPLNKWDLCTVLDPDLDEFKDRRVVGGLDLSSSTDLTGAAVIIEPLPESKIWTVFTFAWLAGESLSECSRRDRLPYEKYIREELLFFDGKLTIQIEAILDVLGKLKSYFPNFKIIGYDPYLGASIKPLDDYFDLVPVPQQYKFLSESVKLLKKKILDREIQHDGNPLLRACVENARVLEDPSGNIRLDKSKSTARIDPLVALIIAGVIAIKEGFL